MIYLGDDHRDVRLEEPKPGSKAEYVALSHCWGGDIDLKLVKENLKECKKRIRFGDPAANFQDAIEVTRELEIRYLWIDSVHYPGLNRGLGNRVQKNDHHLS